MIVSRVKVHAQVQLQKDEDGRAVATAVTATGQNQAIGHGLQIGKDQNDSSEDQSWFADWQGPG